MHGSLKRWEEQIMLNLDSQSLLSLIQDSDFIWLSQTFGALSVFNVVSAMRLDFFFDVGIFNNFNEHLIDTHIF